MRNAALLRLLAGFGAWVAADWAMLVALSVVAYGLDGAGAVGLVGAARVLPGALFAPLVSLLADRLPRARVLAATHLLSGVAAAALAVTTGSGASLPVLLVVVAAGSVVGAAFKPCVNALVPQIVAAPEELVAANAAYTSVEAGATVVGPLLGGLLVAHLRPSLTFTLLAVWYAVAAVGSLTVRTGFQPPRPRQVRGWEALVEPLRGFPVMAGRPGVRVLFWTIMGQTAMRGVLNVVVVLLAARVDGSVAGLFAALGAGGLVGAPLAVRIGGEAVAARRTGLGIMLWAVPILAIGLWPVTGVTWVALALVGLGNALEDAYGFSLLNRMIPDQLAGRAWGAFYTIGAVAVAAGSLLAPVLVHALGFRPATALAGAALAVAVLLVWGRLRALDRAGGVPAATLALFRAVPALTVLPPLALERLARSAVPEEVPAGAVLAAEGEPGDRFFVIASGEAVVAQGGHEVRRLGAGGSFGEIALLRGVPRTATVTSASPMSLLTVDMEAFVASVTGHRDTFRVADDAVTSLLAADTRR